jgi:hypothetical protein
MLHLLVTGLAAATPHAKGDRRVSDGSRNLPWINLVSRWAPNHRVYNSTDSLHTKVDALLSGSCSHLLTRDNPTLSTGAKDAYVLRLKKPGVQNATKILYNFGIHGREYIAGEVAMVFLTMMCNGSPRSEKILDTTEFMIIPVLNVAGRKKAEKGDASLSCASQRKDENEVDLNRNFDFHWDEGSDDSTAEDYRGPGRGSENETQLLVHLAKEYRPKLFIDVHSGDESLMYPYSWKSESCPTGAKHQKLLDFVNTKSFCNGKLGAGCKVRSGPAASSLNPPYTASGTSLDYMYEVVKLEYTYTWEVFSGTRAAQEASSLQRQAGFISADSSSSSKLGQKQHTQLLSTGSSQSVMSMDLSAVVPNAAEAPTAVQQQQQQPKDELLKGATQFAMLPAKPSGPAVPKPLAALSAYEMAAEECFAYFNPTSREGMDEVSRRWANALLSVAEYLANPVAADAQSVSSAAADASSAAASSRHAASIL